MEVQKNIDSVILSSNMVELETILREKPNEIYQVDRDGYSLLQLAISRSTEEVCLFLINKGVNINHVDKQGSNALHFLALYYKPFVISRVLDLGININQEDKYGNQPLWTAVFNVKGDIERLKLVKLLLERGADKNHKNKAGSSPFELAKRMKSIGVIELMSE